VKPPINSPSFLSNLLWSLGPNNPYNPLVIASGVVRGVVQSYQQWVGATASALGRLDPTLQPLAVSAGMALPVLFGQDEAVAAETVSAQAGDHIVLGLANQGLEETAAQVGGRTLLNDPQWMSTLQEGITNPSTKITVNLDGLSGDSAYSQVMSAAQRGVTPVPGGYTNWELGQLYQSGRLPTVNFMQGGKIIANPFGP
jgi:hypothetical protein